MEIQHSIDKILSPLCAISGNFPTSSYYHNFHVHIININKKYTSTKQVEDTCM